MIQFKLSDEIRELMVLIEPYVQAAIAIEANKLLGVDAENPYGIFKYEGGVNINGCEICIKYDYLCDDWKRTGLDEPTPEEIATQKAIEMVASFVENGKNNILKGLLPDGIANKTCEIGDPLRSFLKIV
jgi:hypothetical protein